MMFFEAVWYCVTFLPMYMKYRHMDNVRHLNNRRELEFHYMTGEPLRVIPTQYGPLLMRESRIRQGVEQHAMN